MARFRNPTPKYQYANGDPSINGKLHFYESNTAIDKNTYSDVDLTLPNTNPVILNGDGTTPNIFYSGNAKVILTDKDSVQLWERDPVTSGEWSIESDPIFLYDHNTDGSHIVFESIADLRASTLVPFDGQLIGLTGYDTVGDKGGQKYGLFWDSTSTETDNGISIFKETSITTGRWLSVNPESLNAFQAGCKADGVTDDYARSQAYLTYSVDNNYVARYPSGTYLYSSQLVESSSLAIKLVGDGRGKTIFEWTDGATNDGGIDLTYTEVTLPPVVSGFTLQTNANDTGEALKITGPEAGSLTILGPSVMDISARGVDPVIGDCWDIGIHFFTCWYITLDQVTIKGADDATTPFAQTVCWMKDFNIFHVENGILEAASGGPGHGEGFDFSRFEIVGVTNGISLLTGGAGPGTNIGPGHINAYVKGLDLANQYQTKIHDLLLYKTHVSTSDYVAISMLDCKSNNVHDNHIQGSATATGETTGIILSGTTLSDYNNIHDNQFLNFTGTNKVGINISTGSGNNQIHHNEALDPTVNICVQVTGTAEKTNILGDNIPTEIQIFTDADATPSVGNALSKHFRTANSTGATSITFFEDGYDLQEIEVHVNDVNTTFVHGVTINLQGGVDFVAGDGSFLSLRKDQGADLWREVSRRTP